MSANLSIVIVNWNGIKFLPDCIKSIIENSPSRPFEIVVVDNNSTDDSVRWLKSAECRGILGETKLRLIENGENMGFGRANNIAMRRTNSQYVFLLNPDTMVRPGAVDRLIQTLESDEGIGAVAPKIFNADGSLDYSVWAFPPTPLYLLIVGLKLTKLIPKELLSKKYYSCYWHYNERTAVPAFSGAAFMVKRDVINKIGAFDEDFFMYGEDAEWCSRINRNGWKTYFEPQANIYHLGGGSAGQRWESSDIRIKEEQGFVFSQKKCCSKFHFLVNSLTRMFILSILYTKNLITGKDCSALLSLLKFYKDIISSEIFSRS